MTRKKRTTRGKLRGMSILLEDEESKTDENEQMYRYSTFYPHRENQRFPPRASTENSDTEDEG